jgi:hypothetical protein
MRDVDDDAWPRPVELVRKEGKPEKSSSAVKSQGPQESNSYKMRETLASIQVSQVTRPSTKRE